jgi:hypothetical protein
LRCVLDGAVLEHALEKRLDCGPSLACHCLGRIEDWVGSDVDIFQGWHERELLWERVEQVLDEKKLLQFGKLLDAWADLPKAVAREMQVLNICEHGV